MKKFVAILLCMIMGATLITGCNKTNVPNDDPGQNNSSSGEGGSAGTGDVDYPTQTIEIIVGKDAGQGIDLSCRVLAEMMSERLGQSVVINNVVGSGGATAEYQAMSMPADGYTLYGESSGAAFYPAQDLTDITYEDMYCFAIISRADFVLAVPPDSGLEDLQSFKEALLDGGLRCAHTGSTGAANVSLRYIAQIWGADYTDVPYNSGAEGALAVTRGEADFTFVPPGNIISLIEEGLLIPIFSTNNVTSEICGITVPSLQEAYPGDFTAEEAENTTAWRSLFIHNDTPDEIKQILSDCLADCMETEEYATHIEQNYLGPMYIVGDEAQQIWKDYQTEMLYVMYDIGLSERDPAELGIERPET